MLIGGPAVAFALFGTAFIFTVIVFTLLGCNRP